MDSNIHRGTPFIDEAPQSLRDTHFELGRAWLIRDQYSEAVKAFEGALEHADSAFNDWKIRLYLAVAHQRAGHHRRAFRAYLEAIADAPVRIREILPHARKSFTHRVATTEKEWVLGPWADKIQHTGLDAQDRLELVLFLGEFSMELEDYERALSFFRGASEISSEDVRAVEGFGEALWRTGRLDQSIETLNKAYELAEQESDLDRVAAIDVKLIQALAASGEYELALSKITLLLAKDDRYAYKLLLTRSQCHLALGRAEEAKEAAEAAVYRKPATVHAHLLRAQALIALERYTEAMDAADGALQRAPSNRKVLMCKAQALIEGQIDLRQGQKLLKRAVRDISVDAAVDLVSSLALLAWRKDGNANYFVAELYRVLGDTEAALQEVDRALEVGLSGEVGVDAAALQLKGELLQDVEGREAEAAKCFYDAGYSFYWRNEYKQAIETLTRANELNPNHVCTYWYLADAWRMSNYIPVPPYSDTESLDRSLAIWRRGTAIEWPTSDDSWAYTSRALTNEDLSHLPTADNRKELWWEAVAYLERATLLYEWEPVRWACLGRFHRYLENFSCALQATGKAIQYDSDNALALEERAAILATVGDFVSALEIIDKYRMLDSRNPWMDAVKAYVLLRVGEYERALEITNSVIEEVPHEIWYRQLRAECYLMLDRESYDREDLLWIWDRYDPSDVINRERFGWAAYQLGELKEATDIFDRMRNDPANNLSEINSYLGLCYLAHGDLVLGEQRLDEGIEALPSIVQVHDIINFGIETIDKSASNLPHGNEVRSVLDRAKKKIAKKRANLEGRPPAEEELGREVMLLEGTHSLDSWAWIGARAGLARLHLETGQRERAAAEYRAIWQSDVDRTPPRFPEIHQGLEKAGEVK